MQKQKINIWTSVSRTQHPNAGQNLQHALLFHYPKAKCPCSKLGPDNLITQKSKLLIVLLNPTFTKKRKINFRICSFQKLIVKLIFSKDDGKRNNGTRIFFLESFEIFVENLTTSCDYSAEK